MKIQESYQEPAPLSPNKRIENRQESKRTQDKSKRIAKKPLIRAHPSANRKENVSVVDPLTYIDKFINDCNQAVHHSSDSDTELYESVSNSCYLDRENNDSLLGKRYFTRPRAPCRKPSCVDNGNHNEEFKQNTSAVFRTTNKRSFKLTGIIPGITNDLLKKLYEARCFDLQKPISAEQERRFIEYCTKVIQHRRLNLREVFHYIT